MKFIGGAFPYGIPSGLDYLISEGGRERGSGVKLIWCLVPLLNEGQICNCAITVNRVTPFLVFG